MSASSWLIVAMVVLVVGYAIASWFWMGLSMADVRQHFGLPPKKGTRRYAVGVPGRLRCHYRDHDSRRCEIEDNHRGQHVFRGREIDESPNWSWRDRAEQPTMKKVRFPNE